MDDHLYHANDMLELLKLADKHPGKIRTRTEVLLLLICAATSRDLSTYVTRCKRKTARRIDSLHEILSICATHTVQTPSTKIP